MAKQVAYVKHELLQWARESLQLTIEEAADQLSLDTDKLRSWESGRDRPTIAQLRELSRVYRRPLAAFFLSRPPKDFMVPHDFRRLPGEPPPRLSSELLVELRKAQYRRHIAIELAEEAASIPEDFIGSARISEAPESVAARARAFLDVSLEAQRKWSDEYDALNAWKTAIENVGVLIFHFGKVSVSEVRGFSFSEVPFPVIGINSADSPNGRIFSLLHEFCHLLLGRGGSCNSVDSDVSSADQRIEAFCNHVAGSILVPQEAIESESDVRTASFQSTWTDDELQSLARSFRVSAEVILRRLLILGRTSDSYYRAKRKQWHEAALKLPPQKGGPVPVPRRAVRAVGQPFVRLVLDAYYREAITSSDVSEYLGVRIKHLSEIEALLAGTNSLTGGDR